MAQDVGRAAEGTLGRVFRNSLWVFGSSGAVAVIELAQAAVLSQVFGPAVYGAFIIALATVAITQRLFSFRTNEVMVRFVSANRERALGATKVAAITELTASCLATLLLLSASRWISSTFLGGLQAVSLLRVLALTLLARGLLETSAGLFQSIGRFRAHALLLGVSRAMVAACVVSVALITRRVGSVAVAMVVGELFAGLLMLAGTLRVSLHTFGKTWIRAPLSLHGVPLRDVVGFGLSTNASATLSFAIKDVDPLLIGLFRGSAEAGYYRVGVLLTQVAFGPLQPLSQSAYPEMNRLVAGGRWSDLNRLLWQLSKWASAYVLVPCLVLLTGGRQVVSALFGGDFAPAVAVIPVLLVGMAVANVVFWHRALLLALGRADLPLRIQLVLALGKACLALVLIPRFGFLGAAIALSAAYLVGSMLSVAAAMRLLRESRTQGSEA